MMLGFPPPLFFQICWRFVSPAIIFVSSLGALPGGSGFGHRRDLDSPMCAHSRGARSWPWVGKHLLSPLFD